MHTTSSVQRVLLITPLVVVAVLAALLSCMLLAGRAVAHSGGSDDYISVVTSIDPADMPIEVTVKDRDDRLRIENLGTKTLIVGGYEQGDDPYVRIDKRGAFVNRNSTAYYQNKGRYGAPVPKSVTTGSAPKWQLAQRVSFYTFHDHRIHWMSKSVPPSADPGKEGRQKVFDWSIKVKYGDEPGTINGTLYYVGGKSSRDAYFAWGAAVAGVLLLITIFWLDRRRRRRRRLIATS